VERSIARIIDRVDTLETVVPPMDQDKLPDETHEVIYDEEEEVENEEPFNPPRPPLRQQHRDDQQGHQELPRLLIDQIGKGWEATLIVALINSTPTVMMILLIELSL
jgi:hypothetical protein